MKLHGSGAALAEGMGVPVSKMKESIAAHYQTSLKTAQDPDGGPFPAYPSGKSWDEVPGKTGSGKKFHRNVTVTGVDMNRRHSRRACPRLQLLNLPRCPPQSL